MEIMAVSAVARGAAGPATGRSTRDIAALEAAQRRCRWGREEGGVPCHG